MGAWGLGTLENDDASDWVYDLEIQVFRCRLSRAALLHNYIARRSSILRFSKEATFNENGGLLPVRLAWSAVYAFSP